MKAIKPSFKSVLLGAGSVMCLHPEPISYGGSRNIGMVLARLRGSRDLTVVDSLRSDILLLRGDVDRLSIDYRKVYEQEIAKAEARAEHG